MGQVLRVEQPTWVHALRCGLIGCERRGFGEIRPASLSAPPSAQTPSAASVRRGCGTRAPRTRHRKRYGNPRHAKVWGRPSMASAQPAAPPWPAASCPGSPAASTGGLRENKGVPAIITHKLKSLPWLHSARQRAARSERRHASRSITITPLLKQGVVARSIPTTSRQYAPTGTCFPRQNIGSQSPCLNAKVR